MSIPTQLITATELEEIVAENPDMRYELIEGQLIEMPPTGIQHSGYEFWIAHLIQQWNEQVKFGRVLTGEMGFYTRGDNKTVRAADVALVSYQRMPEMPTGYTDIVPELVVEVVSPNDRASDIEAKAQEWLTFGVSLVWVVYPKQQRIHVYESQQTANILTVDDALTGGNTLPALSISVHNIFHSSW